MRTPRPARLLRGRGRGCLPISPRTTENSENLGSPTLAKTAAPDILSPNLIPRKVPRIKKYAMRREFRIIANETRPITLKIPVKRQCVITRFIANDAQCSLRCSERHSCPELCFNVFLRFPDKTFSAVATDACRLREEIPEQSNRPVAPYFWNAVIIVCSGAFVLGSRWCAGGCGLALAGLVARGSCGPERGGIPPPLKSP